MKKKDKNTTKRKLVIAGNYRQFRDYLAEHDLYPSREIRYCCRPEDVLGIKDAEIVCVGEYWLNPLYHWYVDNYLHIEGE